MSSTIDNTTRRLWLVAAPEAAGLDVLRDELTQQGFEVIATPHAEAVWSGDPAELVLIDLEGDSEKGIALIESLRSDADWSRVPIVMLHDGADAGAIARASSAGASEFLERPFLPTLLEHRLNQATRGALGLMEEIDSLGGSTTSGSSRQAFLRGLAASIERSRSCDDCVAVLAVLDAGASMEEHALTRAISQAVREFEATGQISHPKGDITVTCDEGVHLLAVPDLGRLQDAARLGYAIQAHLRTSGAEPCIGISNCPGDSVEAESLCRMARESVQSAVQVGDCALKFASQATDQWVFERLTLERSLRRAIENQELVLYYQPKVEVGTRKLVGFEALVRWRHPELGMVSPAQFIPLAEETGLIAPIGEWVLETACIQNKAWQDAGFDPVRMAVNLSPIQFRQPTLADKVNETLERTGLAAEHLELEVTESMLMHDIRETIETLRRFKAAGVYLSIDDFGTGYSSLSYLKGFPIDALKIDQSFIRDVTANTDDAAIATSIILMGRSLNLKVIAEGVETENQLAFLQVLQCNEIQGYLISPPVPSDEAEAFLTKV